MRRNAPAILNQALFPVLSILWLSIGLPVHAVDLACPDGPSSPCGITYEVSFVSSDGPMGQDERQHYCDAMREAGRKIWIMTEGKHYLERVEFTFDDLEADATWRRSQGSIYHDKIGGKVSMRDNFVGCTTRGDAGCIQDQQLWDLPEGELLCNIETELPNPATGEITTMKFCSYDGGTSYPDDAVPYPAASKGATMAHEIGHQFYNLDDEYTYPDNPQGWPWSIRVCDNEAHGVCIMARTQRPHMCDNGHDYDAPDQPISWSHVSNTCDPHFTGSDEYCGGEYPNGVTCDDDEQTCRWQTIENAEQHSCWALARAKHVDLDHVHEQVGVYPSEAELGDPPQQADCHWTGEFSADQVLLIDRSGSMTYVGDSGVQAVKEAADAALYFYNHGKAGRENGVLAFNESFEWLKPYEEFSAADQSSQWDPPYDNESGGLTASGSTDICGAIIETTQVVRSVHPAKNYGEDEARDTVHAVLFSDGRQIAGWRGPHDSRGRSGREGEAPLDDEPAGRRPGARHVDGTLRFVRAGVPAVTRVVRCVAGERREPLAPGIRVDRSTARVYHAGEEWVVPLHDDGKHGDAGARNGLYAGLFNQDQVTMPSGNYAVKVRMKSYSGTALDADTLEAGPATASIQRETFFRLDTAYFPPDDDGIVDHGTVVTNFDRLRQGETYRRLEAVVHGLPLLEKETRLSLGPEIRLSNINVEFEYPFESGTIYFDAEVLESAATGPRDIRVQVGPSRARGADAFDVECAGKPGTTPGEAQDLMVSKERTLLALEWIGATNAWDGHCVYEGALDGRFDSLVCNDRVPSGVTSASIVPAAGDRYYLVAGLNEAAGRCGGHREGTLGLDSRRQPRLAADEPCP